MRKTKTQKKQEQRIKQKQRLKALKTSENQFVIEAVNGIEIAHAIRAFEDIVMEKSIKHIYRLSKTAIRQFDSEGRGSFLTITEANPNEGVYLPAEKLIDCIGQVIPEALDYVKEIVDDYDPQEQFVVINVFDRKRIAITIDALRLAP